MENGKWKKSLSWSLFPFFPGITRIVTRRLTKFGSEEAGWSAVSFNHKVYGYLRGPETLARALPN